MGRSQVGVAARTEGFWFALHGVGRGFCAFSPSSKGLKGPGYMARRKPTLNHYLCDLTTPSPVLSSQPNHVCTLIIQPISPIPSLTSLSNQDNRTEEQKSHPSLSASIHDTKTDTKSEGVSGSKELWLACITGASTGREGNTNSFLFSPC